VLPAMALVAASIVGFAALILIVPGSDRSLGNIEYN
jgi:hypothetical protein